MPATTFPEYAQHITDLLNQAVATGEAVLSTLQVDQRSAVRGLIAGVLQCNDGSELHFREYVDVTQTEPKIMYAYHYQDADHRLLFRYDNAAHKPALPQPAHKHMPMGIEVAPVPTLAVVLDQVG
jgi:prophage DNA circulation protein